MLKLIVYPHNVQGEEEITVMLSTEKLRHWVTRRRWQRCSKVRIENEKTTAIFFAKHNDPPSQAIRAMKKMSDLMIRRRSLRATASEDWGGSWTGLSGYHISWLTWYWHDQTILSNFDDFKLLQKLQFLTWWPRCQRLVHLLEQSREPSTLSDEVFNSPSSSF